MPENPDQTSDLQAITQEPKNMIILQCITLQFTVTVTYIIHWNRQTEALWRVFFIQFDKLQYSFFFSLQVQLCDTYQSAIQVLWIPVVWSCEWWPLYAHNWHEPSWCQWTPMWSADVCWLCRLWVSRHRMTDTSDWTGLCSPSSTSYTPLKTPSLHRLLRSGSMCNKTKHLFYFIAHETTAWRLKQHRRKNLKCAESINKNVYQPHHTAGIEVCLVT